MNILDKAYGWIDKQARGKHALLWLSFVSMLEGFISPIPPDPMLAIIMSIRKSGVFLYPAICALSSSIGGLIGYMAGSLFFDTIGKYILEIYGRSDYIANTNPNMHKWAFWIITAKAFTPIPYKIIAIVCGFLKINLLTFTVASIISRFIRFFVVSALSKKYGHYFLSILEKNKLIFTVVLIAGVCIGFAIVIYI